MSVDEVLVCRGHRGEVTGLCNVPIQSPASASGSSPYLLVSCSEDGTVKLWDMRQGKRDAATVSNIPNGDELTEVCLFPTESGGGANEVTVGGVIGGDKLSVFDFRSGGQVLSTYTHPEGNELCNFELSLTGNTVQLLGSREHAAPAQTINITDEDGQILTFRMSDLTAGSGTSPAPVSIFGKHGNLAVGCLRFGAGNASLLSVAMDSKCNVYSDAMSLVQTIDVGGWGDGQTKMISNPPLPTCLSAVVPCGGGGGEGELLVCVGRGDGSYLILAPPIGEEGAGSAASNELLEMALTAPGHECNGLVGVHFLNMGGTGDKATSASRLLGTVALSGEISIWNVGEMLDPVPEVEEEMSAKDIPSCVFAHNLRDAARGNAKSPISKLVVNASCVLNGCEYIAAADGLGRISVVNTCLI